MTITLSEFPIREGFNEHQRSKHLPSDSTQTQRFPGLNNHTDQSVPAHGIPALLLVVNYIEGTGYNTLVDGYAVAQALRRRDPAAFKMRLGIEDEFTQNRKS